MSNNKLKRKPLILPALLAGLIISLTGCGYTMGNLHRKGIKTVAVNMFTRSKDIYRRDIEMRLTEAVIKRIELDTPYKVTTKPRADTLLEGTLEIISQQVMNTNPDTGDARELEMVITASIQWKDLRSGKIILKRQNIRAACPYIPHAPFNEDFFKGSEGAINRLAERIVEKMEKDW